MRRSGPGLARRPSLGWTSSSSMPRPAGLPPVCETASSLRLQCASPSSQGSSPGRACWAIGHASAAEIDEIGILRALRLAGERALARLRVRPDLVLLDGNYDWFTRPERSASSPTEIEPEQVTLKVKADLTCASVAAASVIAKVARDRRMVELAGPVPLVRLAGEQGLRGPGAPRGAAGDRSVRGAPQVVAPHRRRRARDGRRRPLRHRWHLGPEWRAVRPPAGWPSSVAGWFPSVA